MGARGAPDHPRGEMDAARAPHPNPLPRGEREQYPLPLPLPLAGEGWGEGLPIPHHQQGRPRPHKATTPIGPIPATNKDVRIMHLYGNPPSADQAAPLAQGAVSALPHGFVTDIESDSLPPGLDEHVIREISRRKREPEFLLKWRLAAYERWLKMEHPHWGQLRMETPDFQAQSYYSAPKVAQGRPQEPRRGRPQAARDLREAQRPAARARPPGWRRRRRRVRQRLGRHHLPPAARRRRRDLLLVLARGGEPPRAGRALPRLRRAARRQLLRRPQFRVFSDGSFVYIPKAYAARWSCPPISASTPATPASSSAR